VTILLWLVGSYLRCFSWLFQDRGAWVRETDLTLGSIRYMFQAYVREGSAPRWAFTRSLWSHWGELLPTAVFQRRRFVALAAGRPSTSTRIPLLTLGLTSVAVLWTLGLLVCCLVMLCLLWPEQRRR
jgi:hypothetical protein